MDTSNQRKKAVVTGSTKGLGLAIAQQLAGAGYDVFLGGRNEEELRAVAAQLDKDNAGTRAAYAMADLSNKSSVMQYAEAVQQWSARLDVLVNNAGIYLPGDVTTEEEGRLEKLIETNLYSAYYLSRALLPPIRRSPSAHIINMCSIASLQAYPGGGSYSISKFALLGFNKTLRAELMQEGIKVSAILPGAAWSDSWKGVDLPYERLMQAADVAQAVMACLNMSPSACVEELVLRPQLGDL
jgi:short-subunit dehydrogenase